jgi:hypothetical protein
MKVLAYPLTGQVPALQLHEKRQLPCFSPRELYCHILETAQQLVGRQVLRNFGKRGTHKGTITSFDEEGELTFRVEYEDGDFEDLVEADVRYTLLDKAIRISARSRRGKDADDSESDYIDEDDTTNKAVPAVPTSQATTQPLELTVSDEPSIPTPVCATSVNTTSVRKRSTTPVRQRSSSALWVPSTCPKSITIHYNAVDRGLCAQTLREHHTILERAMVRLYPIYR